MDKDTISSFSETPKARGGMGRHPIEERSIPGSPSSSASSGKLLPNYLRPSTGSCHDICKYGKKHAFEEETKRQFHHKLGKSREMGHKQQEKDNLNEERRKKYLIKLKSSSFQRLVTSDTAETVNRLCPSLSDGDLSKEKPAKNKILPQKETVLNEWAMIPASSTNKRGQKIKENMDYRITQAVKPSTPVCSNTSIHKSNIYTKINEQKNLLPDNVSDPQRKSIAIKENDISGLQKATALIKPRLLGRTSMKSHSISYKPEISKRKSLTPLKTVVTAAKPGISLKAIKTSVAMPRSSPTPSHGSSSTRKDGDKTSRLRDNLKMVEKVGLKPSRTSSSKVINSNSTTTKNKGDVKCKQDDGKFEEKKTYVSEMKLNDADLNFSQNKVQSTKISEEMPMPEKTSQHSLEKELPTLQNLNVYLSESDKVDSDCQQKKKSNNDQGDETDNCRKQQQPNDGQSFSPALEDKEESGNLHRQEAKDDQSSPSVLDSTDEVADCNQQKLDPNQISEDDLSSQAISENDAETDNCRQHKSFDVNQTSTDDHSASDYDNTDETDCAHRESSQSEVKYEGSESKKNEEMRPRRNALVPSKDNCLSPHKLKFRRGKVIELQPDSNDPKRLRFRRARVISDDGGGTHGRRHLRNNGMDYVLPDDPNPKVETIVLRHKDLQEKKDSLGLFNNVIEETASKLVETRKSKVKALVGAFETVISLQDGKPASTT